ncbi:MAG: prolipoprotein diacylglyceryl transferase [Halanaerobiaceae bacterium]
MIDPVAFEIGSISIRWYGIIIACAFLLSTLLIIREAKKQGIEEDFILDLFIIMLPIAIIAARLYFVIFQWSYYSQNPAEILAIRSGGLAIHGGIIGGVIVLFLFSKKRKVSFLRITDLLVPYLALGQAIGRWGNFINREAFGGVVSEKFISHFPGFIQEQMYIRGNYYHPAFLYESIWNFIVFLSLIFLRRKEYIKRGDIFLLYIIGYSIGRFFIEGIRTDSLMLGPLRVAQIVSIIGIIIASFVFYKRHAGSETKRRNK